MKYLYLDIKDYLVDLIIKNKDVSGYILPSESQLARRFNSSRFAVRHALKFLEDRNYIYTIPGKGRYIEENIDLSSPTLKMNVIDFILPDLKSNHANLIIAGISKFCTENYYELNIKTASGNAKELSAMLKNTRNSHKGVLLFPDNGSACNDEIVRLYLSKFPIVLLDRQLLNIKLSCVHTDNRRMLHSAVSDLYKCGHKSITYFSLPDSLNETVAERIRGFMDGMLAAYGKVKKDNILFHADHSDEQMLAALNGFLSAPLPDAVIMHDGPLPLFFIRLCANRGIDISDMEIILIDDENKDTYDVLNFKHRNLKQNSFEIGYRAAALLHQKITRQKTASEIVTIPATLT